MTFLQAYRVVVLPVANTWMSWSLLHKMSITPSGPLIVLLGIVLLACIIMGLQVRFCADMPAQCRGDSEPWAFSNCCHRHFCCCM